MRWRDPARADEMDAILARFGEVQEEYEHLGGYALESQAREVLHGLGFDDAWIDGDVGALSGGWKMRVAMARALLGPAGCPADGRADEPSRYRIDSLARELSQVAARRAAHDVARPRLHESHRDAHRRNRRRRDHGVFRQLRLLRARAGRCARPTSRRRTRVSRPSSPRSSGSSSGSPRTPPRPRRCRAASRRSTRSSGSSCRRSGRS